MCQIKRLKKRISRNSRRGNQKSAPVFMWVEQSLIIKGSSRKEYFEKKAIFIIVYNKIMAI
tara:strand:- start:536 stop:718 length:183 start_codon:yes stop_codon:yes gene_type:complete